MKAFRDGQRKNPMMSPMAAPLSDTDIDNLAAFYSSLGQ
jgi:cytochrome c553